MEAMFENRSEARIEKEGEMKEERVNNHWDPLTFPFDQSYSSTR